MKMWYNKVSPNWEERRGEKIMFTKMNTKAFTLVEIMIVVAIIGLLAAIAIPNFVNARTRAQTNACIANLKQIEGAMAQYALDNNLGATDTVTMANLVPTYIRSTPTCPGGGTYDVVAGITANARPTCTVSGHTLP